MSKIVTAVITAELPPGVTAKMLREHFASDGAVTFSGPQSDYPMLRLNRNSITVRTLRSDLRVKGLIAACEGLLNLIHNGGGNGNALGAAVAALDAVKGAA